jgi:hypothetical protein
MLTTSLPSVGQLSRQCGILDISQHYKLPKPVMRIVLLFIFFNFQAHFWATMPKARRLLVWFLEVTGFFDWTDLSSCTIALGLNQPRKEMSNRNLSGGKEQPVCKAVSQLPRKCGSTDISQPYWLQLASYRDSLTSPLHAHAYARTRMHTHTHFCFVQWAIFLDMTNFKKTYGIAMMKDLGQISINSPHVLILCYNEHIHTYSHSCIDRYSEYGCWFVGSTLCMHTKCCRNYQFILYGP